MSRSGAPTEQEKKTRMKPFPHVFFEIVGACNAKCPYCVTGAGNAPPGKVLSPEVFHDALEALVRSGAIEPATILHLQNWGEPFLHPRLHDIISVVNDFGLRHIISTNASVIPEIDEPLTRNLNAGIISMPGFSQDSYDKIHQLDFESIKRNIARMAGEARALGCKGNFRIHYHVYQFNLDEMKLCGEFAEQVGAGFYPYCAIMIDWWTLNRWLDNTLPPERLQAASEQLLLERMREVMKQSPKPYACPQYDHLVLDEQANILTCCLLPRNHPEYSSGNVLRGNLELALKGRFPRNACKGCLEKGIAYLIHNLPSP